MAGLKCVKYWLSNLTSALITMVSLTDEPILIMVSLIVAVFLIKKSLNVFAKPLSDD